MKKKITLFVFLCACFTVLHAQFNSRNPRIMSYRDYVLPGASIEAGLGIGMVNALTDIASSRPNQQSSWLDIYPNGFSPGISLYGRYHSGRSWAVRSTFSALMLRGDDAWSPESAIAERGKSFTNNLFELAAYGEYFLPRKIADPKSYLKVLWFDIYLFAGMSAFYHNPDINGPVIDDYDYELLNAGDLYNNWQFAIPFGAGLKWTVNRNWVLGVDLNFRYTFFDYLDGFRRPYSTRYDHFFSTGFNVGYIIQSRDRDTNRIVTR